MTVLASRRRAPGPGTALRVRVWAGAGALDRQLAEGAHPWRSPALALRASQLTDRDQQRRFAADLDWIVDQARTGRPDARLAVPLQRATIISGADDLLALSAALRSPSRCSPRAAALVSYLLHDGCSPLYSDQADASPASVARVARAGFPPAGSEDRPSATGLVQR